ncbi:MAG: aldo/keto reductase [Aggregatilineales bacterium]
MKTVKLGRTGLYVSPLCLGTMNFGTYTEEDDSKAMMSAALDAGINFFDTANVYGHNWFDPDGENRPGVTEEIMGRWFAEDKSRREKTVIATKLGHPDMPDGKGSSARNIKKSCEDSLRRMQTDYIDLYQMHHIDLDTPWEEVWQAMEQLVQEGKVLYVGSSNFGGWHIAKANETARNRNTLGLISEQSLYNLMVRNVELDVLPVCEDYGMAMMPWSPLAGGLLSGVLKKVAEGRSMGPAVQYGIKRRRSQLEAWEAFCDEMGEHPADVALAWLMHNKTVTTIPVIGPRTMQHLEGNLNAPEISLADEHMTRLDEIFRGYKTAPEHYAW